jgi:hypothetical protein
MAAGNVATADSAIGSLAEWIRRHCRAGATV